MYNLIICIWIIDILNIGTNINGLNLAEFLDVTLPLNGWFWFFTLLLIDEGKKKVDIEVSKK